MHLNFKTLALTAVLSFLVLLVASSPRTSLAQEDTTPPTFTTFSIDTPTIDTTSGPDTVRFTVGGVQDDLSGARFVSVFYKSMNGDVLEANCILDSGTNFNGTWKCSGTIPQFSEGGTYELSSSSSVILTDYVSNQARISKAEMETRGFDTSFFNSATNFDSTPPTFTSFSIDTPTIDTTSGPDTVRFTVGGVQDDISGARFVSVFYKSMNGDVLEANCILDSGTNFNGTWKCSGTIPQFSEGGTYELSSSSSVILTDYVSNQARISKAEMETRGFDTSFFNSATNFDSTPPTFTSFTIDTPVIHTASKDDIVRFTVGGVQDDISGARFVSVFYKPPSGFTLEANCILDSGTNFNGTWKCSGTIPQFSEGGTYELSSSSSVILTDYVSNQARISKAEMETRGFDTSFFNDIICGNGVLDGTEQCDEGADNGTASSCCTSSCEEITTGPVCGEEPPEPCVGDECDPSSTITIAKTSDPNDGTDFEFECFDREDINCEGLSDLNGLFFLDDEIVNVDLVRNSETSDLLIPGVYIVKENLPDGWQLDEIDCGNANLDKVTIDVQGSQVVIVLGAEENIMCTFFNSEIPPDDDSPETPETPGEPEEPNEELSLDTPMESFSIVPGELLSFSVDISNPASATNTRVLTRQTVSGVVFKVDLPEGFDIEELITTQGTCNLDTLECTIGDIGPGETVTVAIDAVVPQSDGIFTVSYRATTTSGEEFSGSATVNVQTGDVEVEGDSGGTNGNGGCALSSANTNQTEYLAALGIFLLLPIIVFVRRSLLRMKSKVNA